jgi:hypothetical protein
MMSASDFFRVYWSLIGPFSGIIRAEWLRIIKSWSEAIEAIV